jgi:methoxymalonate biosynthesis acyl carrier protein
MLDPTTSSQVREFISRTVRADYADTDDLFSLGFVNSMFAMQLVQFIEGAFAIEVESEDLELDNFRSVAAISGFVGRKRTAAAATA